MSLPERMKFGIFMGPFHHVGENPTLALDRDLELVEWLDYLGYDEAWIGEHHSAGWESISCPEIFIGVAADRTRHIKLGTGVLSLPYHHPFMVANRMVQLDHMTHGRVMLGVGPGALPGDAYMLGIDPTTQRERMDEAFGIILRLFTEDKPITYRSDWFELKEALLQLRPYQKPHMPIAVAAVQSPAGVALAGKYGAWILTITVPRDPSPGQSDRRGLWAIKVDKEFYVVQGDIYTQGERGDKGMQADSLAKLIDEKPDYVVFNGSVGALMGENALKANVGDTVRMYFGVGGPNITSSFHVIGEVFDRVYPEGALNDPHRNVQSTLVPAGGSTIGDNGPTSKLT